MIDGGIAGIDGFAGGGIGGTFGPGMVAGGAVGGQGMVDGGTAGIDVGGTVGIFGHNNCVCTCWEARSVRCGGGVCGFKRRKRRVDGSGNSGDGGGACGLKRRCVRSDGSCVWIDGSGNGDARPELIACRCGVCTRFASEAMCGGYEASFEAASAFQLC